MRWFVLLLAGCDVTGTYKCTTSAQCQLPDKTGGYCEVTTSACSFDDPACPTLRRYDDSAGDLAGQCVSGIVTGRYTQRFAINDDHYAPQLLEQPVSSPSLAVKLDDGTAPAISYDGAAFSFPIHHDGQIYDLVVSGTTYQLALPHVVVADAIAGRPDRVPVMPSTKINFRYTSAPPGDTVIASTGVWTRTDLMTGNIYFTFDWSTASSLSGSLGLLDASKHDQLYFTRVNTSNGVSTIVGAAALPLMLPNGGLIDLAPTVLPSLPVDVCKLVYAPLSSEATRLGGTMPTATWSLQALPLPALGPTGALEIYSRATVAPTTNVNAMAKFNNPFGATVVARMRVDTAKSIMASGAMTASTQLETTIVTADTGGDTKCNGPMTSLQRTISTPDNPTVANTPIGAEGMQLMAFDRGQPVTITWSADGELHEIALYQVGVDSNTFETTLTSVYDARTIVPSVEIDPALLASGQSYVIMLLERRGYPGAATGDVTTRALPFEHTTHWSHVFTVP